LEVEISFPSMGGFSTYDSTWVQSKSLEVGSIRNGGDSYNTALKKAGIENFTFHDLRHCSVNNLRLAGNDYFTIMAASGHKTVSTFKRYNLVTEEDLVRIKWRDFDREAGSMDTSMDTEEKRATKNAP